MPGTGYIGHRGDIPARRSADGTGLRTLDSPPGGRVSPPGGGEAPDPDAYLALAVALNIPGNYLIGGGGGIALFAGVSRLFSVPGFVITIMLAVAPVPLAVMIFGIEFLPQ